MKRVVLISFLLVLVTALNAQIIEPVKWSFESKQDGNEAVLIFRADIDKTWHLYDTELPEGGPIATTIYYNDSSKFELVGEIQKEPMPEEHFDNAFQLNVRYFSNEATLTQRIKLNSEAPVEISGYVLFMACDDETCLPPNEAEFTFAFNQGASGEAPAGDESRQEVAPVAQSSSGGQALWLFLLISALAGFAAILTPCVFPMIPMTVSFFMRGSENRSKAIKNGLFFGFSIVLVFTLLGALFSFGIFGPNVGNIISTHWIPNLLFFLLFFIFAISFFGAFEIVLPNSLVNKADSKSDQGGMVGAFFMALTTVIVSFSCTGPFIGALIIEAVQDGGMRPLFGMFVFGLAFAAPFTLLAIFPSAMKKLPKSGGWLNAIKVVFAFILLAFGMKFLSNIDQVYGLGLISRDLYLSVWIVIFFFLGLYFLGKIKLPHDTDVPFVSVGRLMLALATFSFVVYLFTGLMGAPLAGISSLLPPQDTRHMVASQPAGGVASGQNELCGPPKYADKLHLPHGLNGYFDYEQGLACAREQNKPAFIVFKGHACANCKKMENTVWENPQALQLLSEKYVVIGLYTDDRSVLPQEEWVKSADDGKVLKTMGKKNLDLQIDKYRTNSIPYHVIIEPDGTEHRMGVTFDESEFLSFIEQGLEE